MSEEAGEDEQLADLRAISLTDLRKTDDPTVTATLKRLLTEAEQSQEAVSGFQPAI